MEKHRGAIFLDGEEEREERKKRNLIAKHNPYTHKWVIRSNSDSNIVPKINTIFGFQ